MRSRSLQVAVALVRAVATRNRLFWLVAPSLALALLLRLACTSSEAPETYCLRSPVPEGGEGRTVWDFEFADPDIQKLERARIELVDNGFAFDHYQYRLLLHGKLIELHVTREEALDQAALDARHSLLCAIAQKHNLEEFWGAIPKHDLPRNDAPP